MLAKERKEIKGRKEKKGGREIRKKEDRQKTTSFYEILV